jgi:hypothetical protein
MHTYSQDLVVELHMVKPAIEVYWVALELNTKLSNFNTHIINLVSCSSLL